MCKQGGNAAESEEDAKNKKGVDNSGGKHVAGAACAKGGLCRVELPVQGGPPHIHVFHPAPKVFQQNQLTHRACSSSRPRQQGGHARSAGSGAGSVEGVLGVGG